MVIILLLLFFIVALIFSYIKLDKDIINPGVIFAAMYVVSVGCAVININRWNIQMSWPAFAVLALGGVEFIGISILIYKYYKKKYFDVLTVNNNENTSDVKRVSGILVIAICLYSIVAIGLMVKGILDIAGVFGEYHSFSEALTLYKYNASYTVQASLPSYVTIILKPVIACAYIMLFLFLKNMIFMEENIKQKIIKYWYYLLPVVLYILQRLMESNRGAIIDFVAAGITMYFILWNQRYGWKRLVSVKTILKLVVIACVGLILFYFSASLIGRINTKGLFEYITYYCGGSIECFNRYIQNPPAKSEIFGEETFYHLIVNLDSLGITNFNLQATQSGHFDFQYYNDVMIGNIYTAYRRWIQDFGILGAAILQAIMALFFNIFYQKIRVWRLRKKNNEFAIILFSYLSYCIYLHPIDGYFYLETFSKSTIAVLVMLYVMYWIVKNVEISYSERNLKISVWKKQWEFSFNNKRKV